MKKLMVLIVVMISLGLGTITATKTLAQPGMMWKGSGGWGAEQPYARMYNPQTVETITGDVVSIDRIMPMKGMSYGLHIVVTTDKETLPVHLGPSWYIGNQDIKILPNDKIEVTGSRVTFDGNPALIAAEVKKGDDVLTLRDANGFPVWSGWRRR